MQPDAVQTAPPIALISWWFGKTEEQRCEFMQGDKASERVRQNILAMEEFATRHCYLVSCNTQLAVHPMPPLSSMPSRSQPHAWKGGLWLPCALHAAEPIACGGRYGAAAVSAARRTRGENLLLELCTRIETAVRDYICPPVSTAIAQGLPSAAVDGDGCARVARIIATVLVEASLAALCRVGLIEAMERVEWQETAKTEAQCGTEGAPSTAVETRTKTAGACRAEARGCLGVWTMLAAGHWDQSVKVLPRSPPHSVGGNWKRGQRNNPQQRNCWGVVRDAFSALPRCEAWGNLCKNTDDDESETAVFVSFNEPRVTITATDMRFGIAKALEVYGKGSAQ
ncbi:hypothetical protein TRVL_02831 [Trypanosoma vivax]|nr:hypothetical protein TRVL_02831 [Trypanosoma vivax]